MEEKFENFVKRLSPKLRGIAHKLNGHFTFFNDDDLFQEAVMHLWIAFNKGSLGDKTDSYVLQGCYFYLKNYIRTAMARVELKSLSDIINGEDSALEDLLAYEDRSLSDRMDELFLRDSLVSGRLTKREDKVLSLLIDSLTVREIGKRLGVSHVMILKIRKRIREKTRTPYWRKDKGYQN